MTKELAKQFPVGASITKEELHNNPYDVYARLRSAEPVSWLPIHNMYYVTQHDLCKSILTDSDGFTVGFERSTVFDVLGEHMMSVDGPVARRMKNAHRGPFTRQAILQDMEARITKQTDLLINGFENDGQIELRAAFASRLPILTMLDFFDLPASDEILFRNWYDAFADALANNVWDEDIRLAGKSAVADFHQYFLKALGKARSKSGQKGLLAALANTPAEKRLSNNEIIKNASIILFGGISTVEALILNAIYALSLNVEAFDRVKADHTLIENVIEETIRWAGPVQSAHRHVSKTTEIGGVNIPGGSTVSCVLAAANHDPAVFSEPGVFDIDRNTKNHLAFATGQHLCLGMHLARAEGRIALQRLLARTTNLRMDETCPSKPVGSEFHQPEELFVVW